MRAEREKEREAHGNALEYKEFRTRTDAEATLRGEVEELRRELKRKVEEGRGREEEARGRERRGRGECWNRLRPRREGTGSGAAGSRERRERARRGGKSRRGRQSWC